MSTTTTTFTTATAFENVNTIEKFKQACEKVNEKRINDSNFAIDFSIIENAKDIVNDMEKAIFANTFCSNLDIDRVSAFSMLFECLTYPQIITKKADNGTVIIQETKKPITAKTLENTYQLKHSIEKDSKGNAKPNKEKTIFGAFRYVGLCECFIRNLLKKNLETDDNIQYHLENVKIENETIFTEKDGICFKTNSNTALDKQANLLIKFFGNIGATIYKKQLPALKLSAQKIRKEKVNKDMIIYEIDYLTFTDSLFNLCAMNKAERDLLVKLQHEKTPVKATATKKATTTKKTEDKKTTK